MSVIFDDLHHQSLVSETETPACVPGFFMAVAMAKGLQGEAPWASPLAYGSWLIYTHLPGTGCPGSRM